MKKNILKVRLILGLGVLLCISQLGFAQERTAEIQKLTILERGGVDGGGGGRFKKQVVVRLWQIIETLSQADHPLVEPEVLKDTLLDPSFMIKVIPAPAPFRDHNDQPIVDLELDDFVVGKTLQVRPTFDLNDDTQVLHVLLLLSGYVPSAQG